MKEKLNLSVRQEFKLLAQQLAEKRRRSVSELFEDLVEDASRAEETPGNISALPPPGVTQQGITYHPRKRKK